MKKILVGLVCGAMAMPAIADLWAYAFDNEFFAQYANITRLQREDDAASTWLCIIPHDKTYSFALEFFEADCRKGRIRRSSFTSYSKILGPIAAPSEDEAPWVRALPGSVGETLLDKMCKGQPSFMWVDIVDDKGATHSSLYSLSDRIQSKSAP